MDQRGVAQILCLGDLVGYGPDPAPCLRLIRERDAAVVAGNHDYAVVGRTSLEFFNSYARAAVEWTARELGPDDRAWLRDLPLRVRVGPATLVHASPDRPEDWNYLFSTEDGALAFPHVSTPLCFLGHSHVPGVWAEDGGRVSYRRGSGRVELNSSCRYLINVGSVGQPRDRDPRAAYALWDDTEGWVEWVRVAYPIPLTQQKIVKARLPTILAERLSRGA